MQLCQKNQKVFEMSPNMMPKEGLFKRHSIKARKPVQCSKPNLRLCVMIPCKYYALLAYFKWKILYIL